MKSGVKAAGTFAACVLAMAGAYYVGKIRGGKELIERFDREQREKRYLQYSTDLYDYWLSTKKYGISVENFLKEQGVQSIAIYGLNNFGIRLFHELKDSSIRMLYVIEPDEKNRIPGPKIYSDEREPERKPDLVVVASFQNYTEIESRLISAEYPRVMAFDTLIHSLIPVDGNSDTVE